MRRLPVIALACHATTRSNNTLIQAPVRRHFHRGVSVCSLLFLLPLDFARGMPRFSSQAGGFLGAIETNRQSTFEPACVQEEDDDNHDDNDDDKEYGSSYPERMPYGDGQPRRRLRTRPRGEPLSPSPSRIAFCIFWYTSLSHTFFLSNTTAPKKLMSQNFCNSRYRRVH